MSLPVSKNMSSISGAKSGSVICEDCCIAREVSPILRPRIARPSAISSFTHSRWMAYPSSTVMPGCSLEKWRS